MDVHDKIMLRKRSIIETINDMLKNVAQIVHTRHRSVSNFIVNLFGRNGGLILIEGEVEVKQLTLF